MALKVKDLKNIIEEYAPIELKEDYDNVGLTLGELENEVTSILVSMDCTLEVINEAIDKGCNFILTHHPLLFIRPDSITTESVQGKKIIKLIKNNIALYGAHTNLDVVKGGLNDFATEILGFKDYEIMENSSEEKYKHNSGTGRFIKLSTPISLVNLCERVKTSYNASYIRFSGKEDVLISNIALINGSGEDYFNLAKKMGAQCIITGDTSYHNVCDMEEEGICVIDAGHFKTEWPAMQVVCKILEKNLNRLGYTNKIIISECSKDIYKLM